MKASDFAVVKGLMLTSLLLVLTWLAPFLVSTGTADNYILYEDSVTASCLYYIQEVTGEGLNGGNALKLTPTKWNTPRLNLYCGGGARRDFRPYDVIELHFRSPAADPGDLTFWLKKWDRESNRVSIRNYIAGGVIDNTWRVVTIPLADLATSTWDLADVEALYWGLDASSRIYYVDHIVLRQIVAPELSTSGETAPFPESATVLRLTFSKRYNEATARDLQNYSLQSATDSTYNSAVVPEDAGLHYLVHDFSDSGGARVHYEVFLKFPHALQNGNAYVLSVKGITDNSGNLMTPTQYSFNYDDKTLLNHGIKVNQVGYLPTAPKVGYVGGYAGDLGGGAWAVGQGGALFAWNEQKGWQSISTGLKSNLRAAFAPREDDVWCVGDDGVILRWDGSKWNRVTSPTSQDLNAVHFGPTNIGWAVGAKGTSIRWENGNWSVKPTPTTKTLRGVWAGPKDTAWAVGDGGVILYWDGAKWNADEKPTTANLFAISGAHPDWIWAVGNNGAVLRRTYGHWNLFTQTPGTSVTLRAVATDPGGQVWVGGDDGLLWRKPGFGDSAFVAEESATSANIQSIARQHGRRIFAVGNGGVLTSMNEAGWKNDGKLGSKTLFGVFALPYGVLRLPKSLPSVQIVNAQTSQTVLTVPLKLEAANWQLSGEDVYSFDFSALTADGKYQAYVPGIGVSDPFEVGATVLHNAAYTTARGLYYQRCGIALQSPYAESCFARAAEHQNDAVLHSSLASCELCSPTESPGTRLDARGGWHDAGDFGKYLPTAAASLWYLMTAYDLGPDKFADGDWNIPESGNGIPDLLDEARWEVDWIVRMQAADGGIYHKLTTETWFEGLPTNDSAARYIYQKTTHDTASGAAILALAARLWQPFNADLAASYLNRAQLAWQFLQAHSTAAPAGGFKNPSGNSTGEYNDSDDSDNRLWAAAELYRTTGDRDYGQYFESWWASNSHDWGWNNWQHFHQCAYWAYLQSTGGNSTIRRDITAQLLSSADKLVDYTNSNPYRNGARLDVPEWVGWGAFSQSTRYSFPLLQAWRISENSVAKSKYLNAALLNLDAQLGANPQAVSFITGLGARAPKDPLHMSSIYDQVEKPVPGIPVFGLAAHLANSNKYYIASQSDDNSYPYRTGVMDPYPVLRRYIDTHELVPMSEFTIVDMATCAGVFGLLDDQ
jgi:hypothetical protein